MNDARAVHDAEKLGEPGDIDHRACPLEVNTVFGSWKSMLGVARESLSVLRATLRLSVSIASIVGYVSPTTPRYSMNKYQSPVGTTPTTR